MDNTLLDKTWLDFTITSKNKEDDNFVVDYIDYFNKINERNSILEKGNYWFNFRENYIDDDQYLEDLVSYKIPNKKYFTHFFPKSYAQKITKLKGFVTDIEENYFEAKLFDPLNNDTYEIGEFDIIDVDKDDLSLLSTGAVFYWTFGHFIQNQQVKKMSEIRFQRIAQFDSSEIDKIVDDADKINDNINWK